MPKLSLKRQSTLPQEVTSERTGSDIAPNQHGVDVISALLSSNWARRLLEVLPGGSASSSSLVPPPKAGLRRSYCVMIGCGAWGTWTRALDCARQAVIGCREVKGLDRLRGIHRGEESHGSGGQGFAAL